MVLKWNQKLESCMRRRRPDKLAFNTEIETGPFQGFILKAVDRPDGFGYIYMILKRVSILILVGVVLYYEVTI